MFVIKSYVAVGGIIKMRIALFIRGAGQTDLLLLSSYFGVFSGRRISLVARGLSLLRLCRPRPQMHRESARLGESGIFMHLITKRVIMFCQSLRVIYRAIKFN